MDAITLAEALQQALADLDDDTLADYQVVPGVEVGLALTSFGLQERASGRVWAVSVTLLAESR